MADAGTRTVAIHQVTEGGRPLREVRHPLAPELLVAEMAGELPPDVAQAVRQHIAVCESCGTRARALAAPYETLGALADEPVPYVPDLRRSVRLRVGGTPLYVRAWQVLRHLGGGSLAAVFAIMAILLVVGLSILTAALQTPIGLGRSQNGVASPPAAGASAVLYAQTSKVLDVRDHAGRAWPVAEVIAVDERTGSVVRSLPADGSELRVAHAGEAPANLALAPNGNTLYELTSTQAGGQALLAIDTRTGDVRWVTPLTLPGGQPLPEGTHAVSAVVAPDGRGIYLSLTGPTPLAAGPRVLAVEAATGRVAVALAPSMPAAAPLPPDGPTLPGVTPPPAGQFTPAPGAQAAYTAGGAIAVSPDGRWLFDLTTYAAAAGQQMAVVRRFSAGTGETAQTLALPGDFRLAALAASPNPAWPLLYLATGGASGQAYVLSANADGPMLVGEIPLGGPAAPPGTLFTGQLALSPSASGRQAYISADVAAGTGSIAAHDVWLVDGGTTTVAAHRVPFLGAGQVLANRSGGAHGQLFELLAGQVYLLAPSLASPADPTLWLRVADGQPVVALIGTGPA